MRFGRDLHKHQIPEWAFAYICYSELKKRFRFAAKATIEETPDVATIRLHELTVAVQSDITAVETFYTHQLAILERKAASLCNRYGCRGGGEESFPSPIFHFSTDKVCSQEEGDELLAMCLELRLGFKKLQWYGRVNRDGFSNVFGKLTRFPKITIDSTILSGCEFAGQARSMAILDGIDKAIVWLHTVPSSKGPSPVSITLLTNVLDVKTLPFHRLVTRMAQLLPLYIPQDLSPRAVEDHPPGEVSGTLALFTNLAHRLLPHQHHVLLHKDVYGNSPLHYATRFGQAEVCQIILHFVQLHAPPGTITLTHAILSPGSEGLTPLGLAVTNGHTAVVKTILEFFNIDRVSIKELIDLDVRRKFTELIHIALRSNFAAIFKLLLATHVYDINFQIPNGETALFVAARAGREDYVKMLIESAGLHELDIDRSENGYGWTPLIVACVQGHQSVVEVLINAGADQNLCDEFGWTAKDHVAFRGFWSIGKLLAPTLSSCPARNPKMKPLKTNALPPCKADEARVIVNLGTLNTREPKPALDMDPYLAKYPYNPYPEVGFSIKISAIGATGTTPLIELPFLSDSTNYPNIFTTSNPHRVKLVFSVFRKKVETQECEHIGGAVALLKELRAGLGPERESLIRDCTVPVLDKSSLEPIGAVTFNFLTVKPFPNPNTLPITPRHIWEGDQTQIIGHRGLGQNHPSFRRLQIGENTIQSFLATMALGVSYVECDVQLTRDHIPIIYHDFLVSESGADLAPHNISFDQFMHINNVQNARNIVQIPTTPIDLSQIPSGLTAIPTSRYRAHSFNQTTDPGSRSLLERMKHTHEFKLKGFKGNIRGEHIHAPFTTLEEMLRILPETLGIDIELSINKCFHDNALGANSLTEYPMLWEAEDWKMDLYGVELNTFVDTTLNKVYTFGGRRKIIFTSFSPELCILLTHKQNQYPVLFLNESNLFPTGDVRASNLQEAMHFARHWNLPGVVMSSEPYIMSPKLMAYVKDTGLVSVSFGFLNNDAENALIQYGKLDAIITDDVNLIANTLGEDQASRS